MDPSSPKLEHFLNQQQEQAMVNEAIGKVTSLCWDKCITGPPGTKLSSGESSCLANCAQRYLDVTVLAMKRLHQLQ